MIDEFHEHELLDRTYVVLDQFFKYVLEHEAAEAMAQDDEVRKSLEEAGDALVRAYNLLGERYLD